MKIKYIILILIIPFFCKCQNIEVEKIVNEISKVDQVHHSYVSIGGMITDHYLNFEKIKKAASIDELISLSKSKNKVVACYSAWALCDRKYENIESIFHYFLKDNKSVEVFRGCIVSKEKISSELYHRIFNSKFYSENWQKDSVFFTNKLVILDSIVLYHRNSTDFLIYRSLNSKPPELKNYSRIKHLALRRENEDALISLAKFNNEEDIPSIKKKKTKSFLSIAEFPHPSFWEFLMKYEKNIFEQEFNTTQYFIAIAAFKNKHSEDFLKKYAFNKKTSSKIHDAITYRNDPFFLDLLINIWQISNIIDLSTLKKIERNRPNQVVEIVEKGLLNKKYDYEFKDTMNEYSSGTLILSYMLNLLKERNSLKIVQIINANLMNSEFYELESICQFIIDNKLKESVPTVFKKLRTKPKAFEIFELTKTILAFENSEYNLELKEILDKQRNWDWGNWAKSFRNLLAENNIKIE